MIEIIRAYKGYLMSRSGRGPKSALPPESNSSAENCEPYQPIPRWRLITCWNDDRHDPRVEHEHGARRTEDYTADGGPPPAARNEKSDETGDDANC